MGGSKYPFLWKQNVLGRYDILPKALASNDVSHQSCLVLTLTQQQKNHYSVRWVKNFKLSLKEALKAFLLRLLELWNLPLQLKGTWGWEGVL